MKIKQKKKILMKIKQKKKNTYENKFNLIILYILYI